MTATPEQTNPRTQLIVENIKCDGCGKMISKSLVGLGYTNVVVSPETSSVDMDTPPAELGVDPAIRRLRELGYPLIETEAGLTAAALRAKSYISCAIGRMS